MNFNLSNRVLFWGMLLLYFIFLGYGILHADYLFTDEAFMLWHQQDHHTLFAYCSTQGRALTGWLEQGLFAACGRASNVRYIRVLSLGGFAITVVLLFGMLKRLQQKGRLPLSDPLIYLTVAFVAASLSTTICIGWAVCTEIFIPTMLSLAAGWLLYEAVKPSGPADKATSVRIPTLTSLSVLALGVTALFFYQPSYPFLLLPFYLLFLTRKDGKIGKPVVIGLVYYFAGLGIYFLLFKYSLKAWGMVASPRTALTFNPLDRISFFFSSPMNQAFNGNALFDARSILSQAVFPVLFLCWVVSVFYSGRNIRYLLGILAFWILGYLPQLIARESFGPYRTMLVLSVMIFMLLADTALPMIRSPRARTIFAFILIGALLTTGAYHYKAYLADPLSKEYASIRTAVREGYSDRIREVVFIRASDHGFDKSLGIGSYKDEFGMPSTNKDWTPEPLVKQLVWELTGSRQQAEALRLVQYASEEEWKAATGKAGDSVLTINAPQLLNDLNKRSGHP
ncbi:MAG TPA: hypothetical protein VNS58_13170 [Puia sp.]|nr:hypothetical protein [Puia sp.]